MTREEAIDIAVSALRPVSRERVKKVWMGEWEFEQSEFTDAKYGSIRCSRCKKIDAHGDDRVLKNYRKYNHFCPKCGAPMTNEAVQMVMERLRLIQYAILQNCLLRMNNSNWSYSTHRISHGQEIQVGQHSSMGVLKGIGKKCLEKAFLNAFVYLTQMVC